MKITKNILLIFIFFHATVTYAQKVSNIAFKQEQSSIIVSYDLETKTPCEISLFVSTDKGKIWQGPLRKVTGDVGNKISSGSNNITWTVLEEFEELRGDKIMFQVKAEDLETVVIGTQTWTKKNLDVSKYRNGDIIPQVKNSREWSKLTTGAWCYYNNDPKNGKIYGKLYNWYAINDPRGLASEGFHIPSDDEWTTLTDYLGGESVAGGKMKEKGTEHWESPNTGATNSIGFIGLPGGFRDNFGEFYFIGSNCYFCSSSEESITKVLYRYLNYYHGKLTKYIVNKEYGFSVRCLKD